MYKKIILSVLLILTVMIPFSNASISTTAKELQNKAYEQAREEREQGKKAVSKDTKKTDIDIIGQMRGNKGTNIDANKLVEKFGSSTNEFAWTVIAQIQEKSLPVCVIGLLFGAVMFFLMGTRNMQRRRQGALMMAGFLTFFVLSQVAYVVFLFMVS